MDPLDAMRDALTPLGLSATHVSQLRSVFTTRTLVKGELFLRVGERPSHVAVVARGAVREYYLSDAGKEHNKAFVLEGGITGSLDDLLRDGPSEAGICALEPTTLLCTPFTVLRSWAATEPAWNTALRRAAEVVAAHKAARERDFLLDATGRYLALKKRYPLLEQRVPLHHLASYLGMSPEALSRVRKKLRTRS